MINELMFLFILDFSGSMWQELDGALKYRVMHQNISSMLLSLDEQQREEPSAIMAFGLDTSKKCDDITYKEMKTDGVSLAVRGMRPAPFSRTPLAASIARGTDITIERNVKKVFLFSDGADSCGKDPCLQLLESNEKLKKVDKIMEMTFVGMDLKGDAPRFDCFKRAYSHIVINGLRAERSFDIQETLKAGLSEPPAPVPPYGLLRINGAPPDMEFSADAAHKAKKPRRDWNGSYAIRILAGDYRVRSAYPGTKTLSVDVAPGQDRIVYWSEFFREPRSQVNSRQYPLRSILRPGMQTRAAHPKVDVVVLEGAASNNGEVEKFRLPFGDWSAEIDSPPWLKKGVGRKELRVQPLVPFQLDLPALFEIEWLNVPDAKKRWVFMTDDGQRYYLQKGHRRIPVRKGTKVEWLASDP